MRSVSTPSPPRSRPSSFWQLVERGANVEARSGRSFTPLLLAAKGGHLEALRELRERGHANVKATNDRTFTALLLACQNEHQEVGTSVVERSREAGGGAFRRCVKAWRCATRVTGGGHRRRVNGLGQLYRTACVSRRASTPLVAFYPSL